VVGLGIMLMVLGVVFIGLGYAIRFKGKYDLINDFTADKAAGILDDEYAKGVGSIEFFGGIAMIPLGIAAILLEEIPALIVFGISVFGICIILIIHRIISARRSKQVF